MRQMFYDANAFNSSLGLNMFNLDLGGSNEMWTGSTQQRYSSGSKFIRSKPALDDAVQLWYKDQIDAVLVSNPPRLAGWAYGDACYNMPTCYNKERIDEWVNIAGGIETHVPQYTELYEHVLWPRCDLTLELSNWEVYYDGHDVNGIYRIAGFPGQSDTWNGQPWKDDELLLGCMLHLS